MTSYTCITCRVAFPDPDSQRAHYKTDWHRYNLKRKVAELPPVTADNFNERVLAQQAESAEPASETNYCRICTKKFSKKSQYDNHLLSKKHRDLAAVQEKKLQDEMDRLLEKNLEKGLDMVECEKDLKNLALKNLQNQSPKHSAPSETSGGSSGKRTDTSTASTGGGVMSSRAEIFGDHSDREEDCESVDSWEGEALGLEQCLFCENITQTFEDNVKHMTTAHSFFIPDVEYIVDLEGLIGHLGEKVGVGNMCLWCNHKGRVFTSIQACQRHMNDKGHCKLVFDGDAALEYADYYDYRSSYPDYKPGEKKENEGEEEEEEEEEVESDLLEEDNFQLVLPSGASIGHRSLLRYYRQKLPAVVRKKQTSLTRVMAHYKALGWTGDFGPTSVRRAKDLGYLQRMKTRHHLKLSIKANKFQPHLRQQVIY